MGDELEELLTRGPVVLVESTAAGKFDSATAIVGIARSAGEVWKVATDFASHKTFMPKLVASTPTPRGPTCIDVRFEIAIPFPGRNERYTFRYDLDPAAFTLRGRWLEGNLEDSFAIWRLVPRGDAACLLYFTTATRNFSKILSAIEDSQQTVTVGVNVSSALAVVKAVKQRVER
ncbi:MAG TPA: SRPBCC family protein [Myxococcales bacterium]|nr:SRPBCC family protein [Myxococcales bacterium]